MQELHKNCKTFVIYRLNLDIHPTNTFIVNFSDISLFVPQIGEELMEYTNIIFFKKYSDSNSIQVSFMLVRSPNLNPKR